jgi:hypothetical protein
MGMRINQHKNVSFFTALNGVHRFEIIALLFERIEFCEQVVIVL